MFLLLLDSNVLFVFILRRRESIANIFQLVKEVLFLLVKLVSLGSEQLHDLTRFVSGHVVYHDLLDRSLSRNYLFLALFFTWLFICYHVVHL